MQEREKLIRRLPQKEAEAFLYDWRFWARPKQLAPPGDWPIWVIRAGRGFGKTRSGSGWVEERAFEHPGRWIALVARTPADARDYMIEGPGGILHNAHPAKRPIYEPSKRRLVWPNGSWATVYSDAEPEALRGFSGDTAWLDEFAKYRNPQETWDNLAFGMREPSNDRPRRLITTTPRPIDILKEIEQLDGTVVVTGSSYENRSNLDAGWFEDILSKYKGTRLGRQEIYAEIIEDVEGALWTRALIDPYRLGLLEGKPAFRRIVVAVDPAVTSDPTSAETGIVVAALGENGHGYPLADLSGRYPPAGWARLAVKAYHDYDADCIVGEVNNGGDLVERNIRTVDGGDRVPYKAVRASKGKYLRAEPVAALYEQGKVHHIGMLAELEDQMCSWVPTEKSPDRMDALVWVITDLMLGDKPKRGSGIFL